MSPANTELSDSSEAFAYCCFICDMAHQFIPSSFPEHFRWELADIVGRGPNQYPWRFFPGSHEISEPNTRAAAPPLTETPTAGEPLLHLIEPEHHRGDGIGGLDDAAEIDSDRPTFRELKRDAVETAPFLSEPRRERLAGKFRADATLR